jgi:hypothetical protein
MGMDTRWVIYIDIEGFSNLYQKLYLKNRYSLVVLRSLMEGIYNIGNKMFKDESSRLFAHQAGDGFFITGNCYEENLSRPVNIAICLLRHIMICLPTGMGKAFIAEGEEVSDITGCYPQEIVFKDGSASMGAGVMTIAPVMGKGMINAYGLSKEAPSGSLLLVETKNINRLPRIFEVVSNINNEELSAINWIKGEHDEFAQIMSVAGLRVADENTRIETALNYIKTNKLKEEWILNTNKMIH